MALFAASVDAPEKNARFAKELELSYPILSDPDKKVAKAYGVLHPIARFATRTTVYIGIDGKVLYIDKKVKPATAGADMIRRLEELGIPRRPKG